jgi:hypothetical protein
MKQMGNYTLLKDMERRIRLSKSYDNWVRRNKAANCIACNATEHLECHHVVDLYSILNGLWKFYGNAEQVYAHAIAMHDNDRCESATLCNACHGKHHVLRVLRPSKTIRTNIWTAYPRNLDIQIAQSNLNKIKGSLGLVSFQTLLGIGWYILNGHFESKMITFNRRRFAELIGKKPSTSFNKSFHQALIDLKFIGVLAESHISGNNVELHLADEYLNMLAENPWFMSLEDVQTSKPCVLALKWFLGVQSNRTLYSISLDKLMGHIGIRTSAPQMAVQALRMACKHIGWARVRVDKGLCSFVLKKRGSTPIFSLRPCLQDAIEKGR